jgi:hypothetical protein
MNSAERSGDGKNVIAGQPRFLYNLRQSASLPAIPGPLGRRHAKGTAASARTDSPLHTNPKAEETDQ